MRVLVCGGRRYNDYERLVDVLDSLNSSHIICGGAPGADWMATNYAISRRLPQRIFEADWDAYGRAAGPIRNQQMLDDGRPDLVVAFPGGRGTADMVRRAKKAGFKVIEVSRSAV